MGSEVAFWSAEMTRNQYTVRKIKPEIHGLVPINQELVFKYQVISTKREVFMDWFTHTIYSY